MNDPLVGIREGKILVGREDGSDVAVYARPGQAAAALARMVAADDVTVLFGPSCLTPVVYGLPDFDRKAFAETVGALADGIRAGRGWAVEGTAGRYTAWHNGEAYQVTDGRIPGNDAGYASLSAIRTLKGIAARDMSLAAHDARNVRATPADIDGKEAWKGHFLHEGEWHEAVSLAGPILYTTPEQAREGARVCLVEARDAGPSGPRP